MAFLIPSRKLRRISVIILVLIGACCLIACFIGFKIPVTVNEADGGKFNLEKEYIYDDDDTDVVYKHYNWALEKEKVDVLNISTKEVVNQILTYREQVEHACTEILSPFDWEQPINSEEFMINHQYKLIYCNIFKAASSTWIYNFLLMAGANEKVMGYSKSSPVEYARKKFYPRPGIKQLEKVLRDPSYESLLIVREPFERLLSAFRDKIENQDKPYYRYLRCQIEKRTNASSRGSCKPSFSQFVDFIIDEHNEGNLPNEHWATYQTFCTPCQTHFDYILRFESLDAQHEAFKVMFPKLSSVLKSYKFHSSHTNYDQMIQKYYSQLTGEQIDQLLNIYEKDFDIFGYDKNIYYSLQE